VAPFGSSGRNLARGRTVYLRGGSHVIERARPDQAAWIIKLSGLDTRTVVETLHGELLEVPDRDVLRDDDDSYFLHELIGLRVLTVDGEDLGELTEVLQPGGNDVYVVTGNGREVLVPAIGPVVQSIDLAAKRVTITPLPGLLDESK